MPPTPSTINVNPQTSATQQPGYVLNPAAGAGSLAAWKDTAISALAYQWATATPEQRSTFLGSTSKFGSAYGAPSATDGVDANGNVYTSPQTLLALSQYIDAGNYGPELLGLVGQPPKPGPNEYIESPEAVANRVAQANADRAFNFNAQESALDRQENAATRAANAALAAQQIAASSANAALAAQASMYGADKALEGTKYSSDNALFASLQSTRGSLIGNTYGANEASRLGALQSAGSLATAWQGLKDARTNQALSLRFDPSDLVARELTSRALLKPEGYTGPAFQDVPQLEQALNQLLNWQPGMTIEQALAMLGQGGTGGPGAGGLPGGGGDGGPAGGGAGGGAGSGGTGGGGGTGGIQPSQIPQGFVDVNPNQHGMPGIQGFYDMNKQMYVPLEELTPYQDPLGTPSSYEWGNTPSPGVGNTTGQTDAAVPNSQAVVPGPLGTTSGQTDAYPQLPNKVTIPGLARGGFAPSQAVVGDPQVPGEPNKELVIDRHPAPGFDVIPLNRLSPSAIAATRRLPHAAWGGGWSNDQFDKLASGFGSIDTNVTNNTAFEKTAKNWLGQFGGTTSWQTPSSETQATAPATTTEPTPLPPAQVNGATATAPAPAPATSRESVSPSTLATQTTARSLPFDSPTQPIYTVDPNNPNAATMTYPTFGLPTAPTTGNPLNTMTGEQHPGIPSPNLPFRPDPYDSPVSPANPRDIYNPATGTWTDPVSKADADAKLAAGYTWVPGGPGKGGFWQPPSNTTPKTGGLTPQTFESWRSSVGISPEVYATLPETTKASLQLQFNQARPEPTPTTPGQSPTPSDIGRAGDPNNPTITSYPDEVYQNSPTTKYLQGKIPLNEWLQLNTGTVKDAFNTELPDIGGLNLARIYQIMQDPEAYKALGSRYKSANRNLEAMLSRAVGRAPRGMGLLPSMIET